MTMRKLFLGLLVLGLAVSMIAVAGFAKKGNGHGKDGQNASDSAIDAVTWTVQKFIELTIDESDYDFGTIDAGVDTVSDDKANTLAVRGNASWELEYAVEGAGSEHLVVALEAEEGTGDAEINIGYSLHNLRSMDPGDYSVTVTYTVTPK